MIVHSYTIESLDSLMSSLIEKVRLNSGNKVTKFSKDTVTRGLLYAFSSSLSYTKGYVNTVESRRFLSTCYGTDLDNYASEYYGEKRRGRSKSSAELYILADPGTVYPIGTKFQSISGIEFQLIDELEVQQEGFAFALVESVEAGAHTKVYAETISKLVDKVDGHISCTNFTPALGGFDIESDEELRSRLYTIPQKTASDTPAKIEAIAYELISDLGKARCFASSYGKCYLGVVKTSGAPYSQLECQDIANKIQSFLNYSTSMNLDVKPLTRINIEVEFSATIKSSVDFTDAYEQIQAALLSYLDPRFYTGDMIRSEKLIQVITEIDDILDIDTSTFKPITDISTPITTLPFLHKMTIHLKKDTGDSYNFIQNIPTLYYSSFTPNKTAILKECL